MVKLAPHNLDAEEGVLGSLLIEGELIGAVSKIVTADDFYNERNRWIYQACEEMYSRREKIDQITLAQELDRQGKLVECGGAAHLNLLISMVPTSMDAEYYAEIVRRLSVDRQLISVAQKIEGIGFKADPDTNAAIDTVSDLVDVFKKKHSTIDDLITPADAGNEILNMVADYSEPSHSIPWGFKDLDNQTAGIFPELTVIGARPSIGKTELMMNIAGNIWDKKVLFCSAEMGLRGLLERKIARHLKIDVVTLRKGNLTPEQLSKVSDLSGQVGEESVYYLPPNVTSQSIYNRVKQLKETIGVDIVFVDYLQILKDCWVSGRDNMIIRVGKACKVLKGVVNDFNIPVICASQLSRNLEYRAEENRKPRLADLRESGDIEQDSDNVLLLWRDKEENPEILEVKIAKGRQIGDFPHIKLVWLPQERRYGDYSNR